MGQLTCTPHKTGNVDCRSACQASLLLIQLNSGGELETEKNCINIWNTCLLFLLLYCLEKHALAWSLGPAYTTTVCVCEIFSSQFVCFNLTCYTKLNTFHCAHASSRRQHIYSSYMLLEAIYYRYFYIEHIKHVPKFHTSVLKMTLHHA